MKSLFLLLFAGLVLSINGNSFPHVNEIKRETPITSKTVYVDLSLNSKFLESGANPYFHYGETNISLVLDSNDIYHSESQLPVEIFTTGFELCSFSGTYKTDLITDSLLKEDRYNYICLASYVDGSKASIEGYGFYGEKAENPGATYKTHRVWLNNNKEEFYSNDGWGSKYNNAVMYYSSDKWNLIVSPSIANTKDGSNYYYVDLPTDVKSLYFVKLSSKDKHDYLIYNSFYIEQVSYGVCYFNNSADLSDITTQFVMSADVTMLAFVVEAYLTYGNDPSNGAVKSTMQSVYSYWFKNKAATDSELKSTKILDYSGYAKNGNSYEGLEKDTQYSVNDKWATMCSLVGIDPKTGNDRSSFKVNTTVIIIVVSITIGAIVVFGIILFIKKRRIANS